MRILILFVLLLLCNLTIGQIGTDLPPFTFGPNVPERIQGTAIPNIELPKVNREDLLKEDANTPREDVRFGFGHEVEIDVLSKGVWNTLADGSKICRLQLSSIGAYAMSVEYKSFFLPKGSSLHVYMPDRRMRIGGFTDENNRPSGKFATQLVAGDSIILEYFQEPGVQQGSIEISRIIHDYIDILGFEDGPYGNADNPCHINVDCVNDWDNQKRAVGLVTTGTGVCSGCVVTNTADDGTPYFLSALHCFDDGDGIMSAGEISSVENNMIVYFNHESGDCPDETYHNLHTMSGCTYLAGSPNTDFSLLVFDNSYPSHYNIHYAGWSRSMAGDVSSFGIHHPGGDIKKFSRDDDPYFSFGGTVTWDASPPTPPNTHWRVWNDFGLTEGGSSGSPLFNSEGLVVGQLHGGGPSDCATNGIKLYGQLDVSWEGDGTADSRLRDYLDPLGLDPEVWGGWDPTCNKTRWISEVVPNTGNTVWRTANSRLLTFDPYVVDFGADVIFAAGDAIELNTGFEAHITSNFCAFITPVTLDCNPPPSIEMLVVSPSTAASCLPYVIGANLLHGVEPYQEVILHVNGAEQGLTTTSYTPGDVLSYLPCPNDHFTYYAELIDANGNVSVSNTVGPINVVPSGFPCFGKSNTGTEDNSDTGEADDLESLQQDFVIYPNPSNGSFSLQRFNTEPCEILVFDMNGRRVYQASNRQETVLSINLQNAEPGIYQVHVQTKGEVVTKSITVQ